MSLRATIRPPADAGEIRVWATPEKSFVVRKCGLKHPAYVIARLFHVKGDEYMMRPLTLDPWRRNRKKFCEQFNIELSDSSLAVLVRAGFVESRTPTPFTLMINVASLMNHLEKSAEPGFWTRERRLQYQCAYDEMFADPVTQRSRRHARKEEARPS